MEDSYNHMNNDRVTLKGKKLSRPERAISTVLSKQVLGKKHRFSEVALDVSAPTLGMRVPRELFRVKRGEGAKAFGDIVSTKSTTSWWSPAVDRMHTPVADITLIGEACRSQDFGMLGTSWLGALASVDHQLVLRHTAAPDTCYIGLGPIGDSCVLLWPLVQVTAPATGESPALTYFEPHI